MVGGKDLLPKAVPPTALEMTRMIATCRVVLPATMVRLSAGRMGFSQGEQTLMFLAGANSIFYGEQLLTTANPEVTASAFTSPLLSFSSFCYLPPCLWIAQSDWNQCLPMPSVVLIQSPISFSLQVDKDRQLFAALGLKGKVTDWHLPLQTRTDSCVTTSL